MKCSDEKSALLVCGREVNRVRETDISAIEEFPLEPVFVLDEPIILARVEVNLDCYKKPVVSLDFYTFIQVLIDNNVIGIVINLRLKRICRWKETILKDYEFTRFIQIGDNNQYELRDSFKIIYCDYLNCKRECCEYVAEFVGFRLIGAGRFIEEIRELVIEDSFIRAIVQELC